MKTLFLFIICVKNFSYKIWGSVEIKTKSLNLQHLQTQEGFKLQLQVRGHTNIILRPGNSPLI